MPSPSAAFSQGFSIITVTYKCVATVGDCLDSVASQTHADREHSGLLRRGWMPPHPTLYPRRSVYARLEASIPAIASPRIMT